MGEGRGGGCLSLVSELLQSHRWSDHVRLKLTENETQEPCHLFQKEMLLGWVMGENPLWRKIVAHGAICEVQLFWNRKEKARAVLRCGGSGVGVGVGSPLLVHISLGHQRDAGTYEA